MANVSEFEAQRERILADRRRQAMDWWGLSDSDILNLKPEELLRKAVGLDARKAYEFNKPPEAPLRSALLPSGAFAPTDPEGAA